MTGISLLALQSPWLSCYRNEEFDDTLLGTIAAVSLLVGAVGIANTMFTSVLEKTGDRHYKTIGAKNRDILMIFLFNSAMAGFVGGIFGVILGAFVSSGLQAMMGQMTSGGGVSLHLMVEGLVLEIVIV